MRSATLFGLVSLLGLSSCTIVPETGRRQFNLISSQQASTMGLTEFEKIKRTKAVSSDPSANQMVARVASRLTRVIPLKDASWEFIVFRDKSPNAFALPGGKVGVNTGLFPIAQNDAGLAAVLGHEIAHVVAEHGGERLTHQLGSAAVGALLGAYLNNQTDMSSGQRTAVLAAYGAGSVVGHTLPHSRRQELEADQIGTLYMARAGYDPREAIALWQRFAAYKAQSGQAKKSDFLSTHPLDATRIQRLQGIMPQALAEYQRTTGITVPLPGYNRPAVEPIR